MTQHLPEFFIVVDVEASGPIPGKYAMLSLGAATVGHPQQTCYIEFQPDTLEFQPSSLAISGLSLETLEESGTPPAAAMQQLADWVSEVTPEDHTPVFTAFNAPFDWMFVCYYFHHYLGYNPFGHKALDIKALFMGVYDVPFSDTSHHLISQKFGMTDTLSHHALEDAVQEAQLLERILAELRGKEKK